ncbi:MAG: hypothetical protein ACREBV_01115 [Candidatus Zixiibacteriota bacterium]
MKSLKIIRLLSALSMLPISAAADVQVSGLADFVVRNSQEEDITNFTFRGFSNFHTMRTRLFFDGVVDDNTAFFVQVLINLNTFQLYGAYAQFKNLYHNYLNANVGIIPIPIGSFGSRTYSDKNPLIGTPLLYNFHTALTPGALGQQGTISELLAEKNDRSYYGVPVIYDACWSTGGELYGSAGKFDYSLGFMFGSVSNPSLDQTREMPQFTTHWTYNFQPGLKVGMSAFMGPYLSKDDIEEYGSLTPVPDPNDYFNTGVGYELYYSTRFLEIYSEGYTTSWEYPGLPDLTAMAGYLEAKYKFHPRWYAAGRFDLVEPGKIDVSPGVEEKWDYPLKRYEFGLGYKPSRSATVKFVTQLNYFDDDDKYDSELIAVQLSALFN